MNDAATVSETISFALRPGLQRKASLLIWNPVRQGQERLSTFRRHYPGVGCTSGRYHVVMIERAAG
jgi:hypothetical protein